MHLSLKLIIKRKYIDLWEGGTAIIHNNDNIVNL